jgi:hypothetical protein
MTVTFWGLLILGLAILVRGLTTVSQSRTAWRARSIAATANVVACRPVGIADPNPLDAFIISVRYVDTRGRPHAADLPAAQEFHAGDAIAIRFDPKHPATVHRSEHFAGTDLPAALIVFGGVLILMSFSLVTG